MFLGPYDQGGDFRDTGIAGMYRWLQKVWRLYDEKGFAAQTSKALQAKLHKTIKKCTRDMAEFKFNTCIALLMECVNLWSEVGESISKKDAESFLRLLAPFAPYMTEEIYQTKFKSDDFVSIHTSGWPTYNESLTIDEMIQVVVQINGKIKARVLLPVKTAQDKVSLEKAVMADVKVQQILEGKTAKQTIVVPGKLVNVVM